MDAGLLTDVDQVTERLGLTVNEWDCSFHEPVQITHLVPVLFHEVFKAVGALLCFRGYWQLRLVRYLIVGCLPNRVDCLVLHFEVIANFSGNLLWLFHVFN